MITVLVADDEAGVCSVVKLLLARQGYTVITCSDGQAALDLLATEHFAAILTDLNLPRVHGLKVIEAARAIKPGVPIVVMSGDDSPANSEAPLERIEGLYRLSKPFKPKDLLALIGKITSPLRDVATGRTAEKVA
ncbi:MAG: response regulator [Bradyrhizobium sp.]|uniref:response regulator n=1 Tax=Bradyrhizobium sp. TaxID=376 RepID=UPI001DCE5E4D|nr:response regulator [Bradyrhizobium sp.]MBV9562021.1 response regulator [Bradyrhizobium sp.]